MMQLLCFRLFKKNNYLFIFVFLFCLFVYFEYNGDFMYHFSRFFVCILSLLI